MSILHLAEPGPIADGFFSFIEENFDCSDHKLLSSSKKNFDFKSKSIKVKIANSRINSIIDFIYLSHGAETIIIHGLFDRRLVLFLAMSPWLLSRCYWVIWGGDLYRKHSTRNTVKSKLYELVRVFVISRMGHLITHIRGDFELAQKWYGAKGVWHECFMYPSNLYQEPLVQNTPHDGINILLGNSADPSNNHIDALERLQPYAAEDIQIFCPLSYGDAKYAKQVADYGKNIFGDKFNPLLEFMKFDDYKKLLTRIDIAIFNHKRQQGMGNATTLLGMGKKVFMRDDVTPYSMFGKIGIKVFPISDFSLSLIDKDTSLSNKNAVMRYFSKSQLKKQLAAIYR